MLPSKDVLRNRYNTFSNEALLAAKAAGPKGYSPLAWEVILELVAARGLDSPAAPPVSPARPPVSPPTPASLLPPSAPPARPTPPTPMPRLDIMPTRPPSGPTPAIPAPAGPPVPAAARPRAAPAPPSTAADRPVPPAAAAAVSPYLLVSSLRRSPWPSEDPLPTTARDILGFAALIFGVAGVALILLAATKRGLGTLADPATLQLAVATVLSLAYAISVRRPPSKVTWAIAMAYGAVAPVLALAPLGSGGAPQWPRLAAGGVLGLLWLVYFARRRAHYGLTPWGWLG